MTRRQVQKPARLSRPTDAPKSVHHRCIRFATSLWLTAHKSNRHSLHNKNQFSKTFHSPHFESYLWESPEESPRLENIRFPLLTLWYSSIAASRGPPPRHQLVRLSLRGPSNVSQACDPLAPIRVPLLSLLHA